MSRMQFALMLFAAGFSSAILGSSLTAEREPAWDPQETQSAILTREGPSSSGKISRAGASVTFKKWGSAALSPAPLRLDVLRAGHLVAVRASLLHPVNVSVDPLTCFYSVLGDASSGAWNCSTNQTATKSNQSCSVNTSSNSQDRYQCSALQANPPIPTCSTGPGNTSDGSNGAQSCSTQGGASGPFQNGSAVCSAQFGQDCSVYGNVTNQPMTFCSTSGGQHQACSIGNNDSATCTAGHGSTAGKNYCSVSANTTGQYGNKCSSIITASDGGGEGTTQSCSSFGSGAGGSSDFCSVIMNAQPSNAQCTVWIDQGQTSKATLNCSALNKAATTTCSAMINGVITGPDANKHCGSGTFSGH